MSLLKGHFDPSLLNATVLTAEFRPILKNQLDIGDGSINLIDAFQQLLDNLTMKGIIL